MFLQDKPILLDISQTPMHMIHKVHHLYTTLDVILLLILRWSVEMPILLIKKEFMWAIVITKHVMKTLF